MLDKNPNLTTATNSDGETALHVLAHKPSAFVNESHELLDLRRHINIPCELLWLWFIYLNLIVTTEKLGFEYYIFWKYQKISIW